MKKGVVYARYTDKNNYEKGISKQVEICKKWAESNDVEVVDIYSDDALTSSNETRPDFLRMMSDAQSGKFDFVIVSEMSRFSRDQDGCEKYKKQLKDNGVEVVSVIEGVTDTPNEHFRKEILESLSK